MPQPLLAAAAEGGGHGVAPVLLALVAIFVLTRVFGDVAQRFGQPAVLGELLAGVVLGGSVLGVIDPADPVIATMSEIGVVILLFAIGLETELAALIKVGTAATTVAVAGVVFPFVIGFFALRWIGYATVPALVAGAALCATSVGITARVLSELGWLNKSEGKVILGAAVIDDIIGLIILAIIATLVSGGTPSVGKSLQIAFIAIAFVVAAVVVGGWVAKPLFRFAERIRAAGSLGAFGIAFAFALAWLADRSGSAMIVGAFAAGLVLYKIPQRHEVERAATTIGHFFVPVFFAAVGAAVDLRALMQPASLLAGAVLIGAGIVGKVAAGFVPWWLAGDKLLIGLGMVPRGEVGLIFARMGLTAGAVNAGEYGAIMIMVIVTTFVTPPALGWRLRNRRPGPKGPDSPGSGGLDDLVAGTRPSD